MLAQPAANRFVPVLMWLALLTGAGAQTLAPSPPAAPALDRETAVAAAKRWVAGDDTAASELTALGPDVVPAVRGVLVEGGRDRLLSELIEAITRSELARSVERESSLIYYGQFDRLTVLGEEAGLAFRKILADEDAPREVRTRASIALGDIRSVFSAAVLERVQGELRSLARDFLTEPWCAIEASYLLARLGDRSLVQGQIEANQEIAAQTPTPANLPEIVGAHTDLAEVFYRIQDYAAAIKHYQQKRVILVDLVGLAREELKPGIAQEIALLDYNLACSMSLAGRLDACFETLASSLQHPSITLDMVQKDGDLRALRADARYNAWLERRRQALKPSPAEGPDGSQPNGARIRAPTSPGG